ncbi:uncharacterized protein METZ01_LOCUS152465 [marine metagenome]|uniref:Uncharacterized protein n=1 Tax=marine metagenome TaxID=408172 RepID=A0A382AEA5_9ZZZZ
MMGMTPLFTGRTPLIQRPFLETGFLGFLKIQTGTSGFLPIKVWTYIIMVRTHSEDTRQRANQLL